MVGSSEFSHLRSQILVNGIMSIAMNAGSENLAGWRSLYPFTSQFATVDSQRMHYVDHHDGDEHSKRNAQPVLMVHGNPTWSFYYRRLIQSVGKKHRAIAVDHIGCGLSEKPSGYNYCLAQHRDNLVELIEQLDLNNITLVAHDWGGAIGMAALLERPERFQRILLFNTAAFPPPFIPFRIRVCRWPLVGKWGVQGFNMFARAAVTMATETVGGLPKKVAEGMLAPYDSWDNRIAIYNFVKDIPLSRSHPTWPVLQGIEERLSGLQHMPIKLVWGMKDWCFRPSCLEIFKRHWPHADVTEFASAGHYVVEDAADEIEPLVDEFLERN